MKLRKQASNSGEKALTRTEALVVAVVLAFLVLMFLPTANHPRVSASRIRCVNNLKQVGLAFRIFATDHNDKFPTRTSTNEDGSIKYLPNSEIYRYFQSLSNELNTPVLLVCPSDTRREATNFAALRNINISYFIDLDASATNPQSLLAGDRNLAMNGVPIQGGIVD